MRTVRYGDKAANTLDLFHTGASSAVPLVIFIHGGYWQALSKQDSAFPASGFLDQGIAYAALDYTLAPNATLDDIVAECVGAVTFLFENATALGIDPKRISLCGSSAGAHLAAMVCLVLHFPDINALTLLFYCQASMNLNL